MSTATVLMAGIKPAGAAAPVFVNAGTNWIESLAVPKDTTGERIHVTAVVKHDVGVTLTGLAVDDDWNGTDNTTTLGAEGGSGTVLPGGPGNYSTIRYSFVPPNQPGFSCGLFSGTRRVTNPLRMRAITSDGQRTGVVTANVHSVENGQCLGATDYPYIRDQSQSATEITPGTTVNFSFQGDDVDATGSNDDFDKIRWRVRRLNDGAITQGPVNVGGLNDNTTHSINVTFPDRGRYVVEADAGGEDDGFADFENQNQFFRLGAVDVNTAASASPTLSLTPASGVINDGASTTVTASAGDTDLNGRVQMIRWDAENNGVFERRELADNETTGLSATELQQAVTTTAGNCADRTVAAEVTDNGALNGADAIRRVKSATTTIIVNCAPSASGQSVSTAEDTPLGITLGGADPDGDALTFTVVSGPSNGNVTGGTGSSRTYSPNLNFNGSDSFTFRTTDVHGRQSSIATVNINVTSVNDAPVANNQSVNTQEDTALPITLTGSDVDGDALTFTPGSPSNGTVTGTSPDFTYTPALNYNGPDSFTFTVSDGNGGTAVGTVNITVNSVEDGPVADDQTTNTQEDTAVPITLTGSDGDGDPLTFAVTAGPSNGSLAGTAPNLVYTPGPNFNGTDSFDFTVDDGDETDTGTVTINVAPVNDAPVADDQSITTPEDTPISVTLSGSDVDGDTLGFSVVGSPSHGTLAGTAPNLVYTPDLNYFGPDSFTFQVDDGNGGVDIGIVSITVTPVNDPPVADDKVVATGEDSPVAVGLTASDVDGDALTFNITTSPANGTLSGTPPNLVYTPGLNYTGPDQFTFVVSDGDLSDSGTVDITVGPLNDPPLADPQAVSTDEDTPIGITLTGSDADGDSLTFAVTGGPSNGSLSGTAPNLTYTPNLDFVGHDSFTFEADDGNGGIDTAVVDITVGGVNDPPVADAQSVTTAEDSPIAIDFTGSDVDGDSLTFSVVGPPVNGTLTGSGSFVIYSPGLNFNGSDSLTFMVSDGNGGTDTAVVDITVTPVNDLPDAEPQIINVPEDTPVNITLAGTDADGDPLSFSVLSGPTNGTLTGTAPNLTYTPAPDYNGADFFMFEVDDGNGGTDTATVSINVEGAPMIGTFFTPDGAVLDVELNFGVPTQSRIAVLHLSAHLFDSNGDPLAGRTISFSTGGNFVCSAVTDAEGFGMCGDNVDAATALLNLGYQVNFDGDADYTPASAAGPIVQVNVRPS